MLLDEDTLVAGGWCSHYDCTNVIADLDQMIARDSGVLDRAIVQATGRAKSILRARWPAEDWPWGAIPPQEIRDPVAVMSCCRAVRQRVFSGGSLDIYELLRKDCKDAEKELEAIAAAETHVEAASTLGTRMAAIARPPTGELGFRGNR